MFILFIIPALILLGFLALAALYVLFLRDSVDSTGYYHDRKPRRK